MSTDISVWRMTPHHADPETQRQWSRRTGRLAIGWGDVGDLRMDPPDDSVDITSRVSGAYPDSTNSQLAGPSLWRFAFEVTEGDLVILGKSGGQRDVFEIVGPYFWASLADSVGDYQHQRAAVLTPIDAEQLWQECGARWPEGENKRWPFAGCGERDDASSGSATGGARSEGSRYEVVATVIERDPRLRDAALAIHGYGCAACGIVLADRYGELGADFIHIHHLKPLADLDGEAAVDPRSELVPLCPNCHAMAHRRRPPVPIDRLRKLLRESSG